MAARMNRVWLLLCLASLSVACVSTEELYAEYDDNLCPVSVEPALGAAQADSDHLRVVDREDGTVFAFPPEIFFGHDSSALDAAAIADLELVVKVLSEYPELNLDMTGYASRLGSASYNARLSGRRADAVYRHLLEMGIAANRMVKQGSGFDLRSFDYGVAESAIISRRVGLLLLDAKGRQLRPRYADDELTAPAPVAVPPARIPVWDDEPEAPAAASPLPEATEPTGKPVIGTSDDPLPRAGGDRDVR